VCAAILILTFSSLWAHSALAQIEVDWQVEFQAAVPLLDPAGI
jgi:hypothetical protein